MERVQELLSIAEHKTEIYEGYGDDEWDEICKLDDKMFIEYASKLSAGLQIGFPFEMGKRFLKSRGDMYSNEKRDFSTLEKKANDFVKGAMGVSDFSKPKTETEQKYGYLWAFLFYCHSYMGISLRKLEKETGIKKDVLHKHINDFIEYEDLTLQIQKHRKELRECEIKREKIKL